MSQLTVERRILRIKDNPHGVYGEMELSPQAAKWERNAYWNGDNNRRTLMLDDGILWILSQCAETTGWS